MITPLPEDACYLALRTRDARFDGRFFTGVASTGVYCRPVCRVRTPRRENCRFFTCAAQAEQAGFRPCLRCRPELAPAGPRWSIQDAGSLLARQAAQLIDAAQGADAALARIGALAARLGVSDRHLRRLFEAEFGVAPLQYLLTRRLLTAKQLLTDTRMPVGDVASASGFGSERRFHAAFRTHYGLTPGDLRRRQTAPQVPACTVYLGYRPPCDVASLLNFFAGRQISGIERVRTDGPAPGLDRTLAIGIGAGRRAGWMSARFDPGANRVRIEVGDSLVPVLPDVLRRARALLDLDADPLLIDAALCADFPGTEGQRVPGCVDGFELAVRAVLGQQVTVAAARTLGQRLVDRLGVPLSTPLAGLDRLFPDAATLAGVDPAILGEMGIVRQRQAAIIALARAVDAGELDLQAGADPDTTLPRLLALPGIGPWTAQYIALRALRWPDAFPAGDVALHKSLAVSQAREAIHAAERWRPWRGYATVRAWNQPRPDRRKAIDETLPQH